MTEQTPFVAAFLVIFEESSLFCDNSLSFFLGISQKIAIFVSKFNIYNFKIVICNSN